jgi:rod shape-determining protein MreC
VVLVLLSVSIISLDESGRTHDLTSGVQSVASDVYSPVRSAVNAVIDPIGRFFMGAVNYGSLEQENQKLQAEIGALEAGKAELHFDARRSQELDQLEDIDKLPFLAGLTTVLAAVTSQSTSDFTATITIDKGRDEGVTVGDPVVGAGGNLVGQVEAASHTSATVHLVTDGTSKVGVVYGNNQDATLEGQGAGRPLVAQFVASTTAVTVGETMVTDSLQGADFPPGIPVAKVATVRTRAGATEKHVTATPVADLHDLSIVAVVQWSPSP